MSTRIAHVSDLHFIPRQHEQALALAKSVQEACPDMLVITGDLTRRGTTTEFAAAASFLDQFSMRKLVLPGNHDIPVPGVLERFTSPFRRFRSFFPSEPTFLTSQDVLLVGLNTAVGTQVGVDWSLGRVLRSRLDLVLKALTDDSEDKFKIVATHHPLRQHPLDPVRSRTAGGPEGFQVLAEAGMDMLLHGHLHRHTLTKVAADDRDVYELGASTALSNRERSGPAGYNLVDIDRGNWELRVKVWRDGVYTTL